MPRLAMAMSLLLLLSSISLISISSQTNEIIAKDVPVKVAVITSPHHRQHVILKIPIPILILHLEMMAMEKLFH